VKIRKPSVAFAPGKTIRRAEEGDFNLVENEIDKPVQFAVVHGGKYEYTEETKAGLTIRVASYGGKNERAAKQLTNLAYQIIDYYQWFLGPFPFDEFNIIQVPTWGYGQAPPGTMFITNEAFNSMTGDINKFFSQGINERFAHEIAHQYWAHVVKMPSGEEQWLTESFAEYSAALMIKKMKGNGVYERLVNGWRDNAKMIAYVAPIPMANRVTSFVDRTYLLYAKGPYILYKLHQELGDNQFLTFMKSYQKSFRFKFGTTNDVAGLLQFVTKKDYSAYMDKYFWGTAMPE
jgi:aminopeptidase N